LAIEVLNRQRLVEIDKGKLAGLAEATLAQVRKRTKRGSPESGAAAAQTLPQAEAQITVVLVRDRKIRALNRDYRGRDSATDVLSFPAHDGQVEGEDFFADGYIGDIVIATDTALRQAREAGQSLEREVQELVIHGVLHLCGYDHESDNGEMNRLELRLRKKLLDEFAARTD
jgi:probable rRNA maturation factor